MGSEKTIIKFPLDKETGYPKQLPLEWTGDPRKLYAIARWLENLIDSGNYAHLIEHNDEDAFIISKHGGKFQISVPSFASEEALYVLVDLVRGMGDFFWFDLFGQFLLVWAKSKPRIATPGPPIIAG